MSELKPCPFCGTEPRGVRFDGTRYAISCPTCWDFGNAVIRSAFKREAAVEAWNQRAPSPDSLSTEPKENESA